MSKILLSGVRNRDTACNKCGVSGLFDDEGIAKHLVMNPDCADYFHIKKKDLMRFFGEEPDTIVDVIPKDTSFFEDQYGDEYVAMMHDGHREIFPIGSEHFKKLVAQWIQDKDGKLSTERLSNIKLLCKAKAYANKEKQHLYNRYAKFGGATYIDMCNEKWQAIRIDANGWYIDDLPPILFRRYKHMRDITAEAGTADDWKSYLNTLSIADKHTVLVEGWIGAALDPDAEKAILVPEGLQGAGKTSSMTGLRELLDPSATPTLRLPKDGKERPQILNHNYCAFWDNVHRLSQDESDDLCRAATGEGIQKRTLFSDDDDRIYHYKRCVALNSRETPTMAPDFLDRSLRIELERIPKSIRKTGTDLNAERTKLLPKARGYLYQTLAKAMTLHSAVKESLVGNLPRMADFATSAEAFSQAMGYRPDEFMQAYNYNIGASSEVAVMGTAIGQCVIYILEQYNDYWEGTPAEFLNEVRRAASALSLSQKDIPEQAGKITTAIKGMNNGLLDMGVIYDVIQNTHPKEGERRRTVKLSRQSKSKPDDLTSYGNVEPQASTRAETEPRGAETEPRPAKNEVDTLASDENRGTARTASSLLPSTRKIMEEGKEDHSGTRGSFGSTVPPIRSGQEFKSEVAQIERGAHAVRPAPDTTTSTDISQLDQELVEAGQTGISAADIKTRWGKSGIDHCNSLQTIGKAKFDLWSGKWKRL